MYATFFYFLGLSVSFRLWWYLLIDISIFILDLDLSVGRTGDQPVHRVFVDPGGSHCIATVLSVGGAETYYTHAKWGKPRILNRLKGLVVNAVAWNRQQITEGNWSC